MPDDERKDGKDEGSIQKKKQKGIAVFSFLSSFLKIFFFILLGILLIIVVTILTLNILNSRNLQGIYYDEMSSEFTGKPPILEWYSVGEIRGHTKDVSPQIYVVDVSLGIAQKDRSLQTELIQRKNKLIDIIRSYFSTKTADYLKNERRIKLEMQELINNILIYGQIQDIVFINFSLYA